MKRGIILAAVLCLVLLAGCGSRTEMTEAAETGAANPEEAAELDGTAYAAGTADTAGTAEGAGTADSNRTTGETETTAVADTAESAKTSEGSESADEGETANTVTERHIVAVDAGHQGSWVDMSEEEPIGPGASETKAKSSSGTTGSVTGMPEYHVNLDVSLALRDELERRGYQVVMTREDNDTAISNQERARLATEQGAEITVRIHANGSEDASISGALAMAPSSSNPYVGSLAAESRRLSEAILNAYCEATGIANQGILETDEMTGINWSTVPVTILEMGYMTNEGDDRYLADSSNYTVIADGIADGIDAYFGVERENPAAAFEMPQIDFQGLTGLDTLLNTSYLDALTASGEKWAVAAVNLNTASGCLINGEATMQSASVIKMFIMATVYERAVYPDVAGKELIGMGESYDGELKQLLTDMITVSDNEAANELVRRLGQGDFATGAAVVNEFCLEHGFTATHLGRAFMAENPSDDNYTSAKDCAVFLSELYQGTLISPEASGKMLELLEAQTRTGKIPAGVPQGVATANKTGEMPSGYGLGSIENDAALVFDRRYPYVLCVLSNDIADNGAAQNTIVQISSTVYSYLTGSDQ